MTTIHQSTLRFATALATMWASSHDAAVALVADARTDDRGEITSTTIVIAALAALALAVMAVITALVTSKASSISV